MLYTAISIKVVHEQSGKVEYERKSRIRARKAAGNRFENSLICQRFPAAFRARIRLFRFARGQP